MRVVALVLGVFFASPSAYGVARHQVQTSPGHHAYGVARQQVQASLRGGDAVVFQATKATRKREPAANATDIALNAPLSEEGYQEVLAFADNDAMAVFVQRLIHRYHGKIVLESHFHGSIPFVSGDRSESSFNGIIQSLILCDWVVDFRDASKASLDEDGYQEIASMKNSDQMRAFVRRVIEDHEGLIQENEEPFFQLIDWYSGVEAVQSYEALIKELSTVPWLSGFKMSPRPKHDPKALVQASSDISFFERPENGRPDELLFIGIISEPRNFERRREIRESWMMDRIFHEGDRPRVKAKFIIGEIWPEAGEDFLDLKFQIEEENRMHGDIVEVPMHDNPENRNVKPVTFLRWFSTTYCCVWEKHYYAMSLNEDTWPNMNLILSYLKGNVEDLSQKKYIGGMRWSRPVERTGEARETASMSNFSLSHYPVHAVGGGFIVDMELAREMDRIAEERGMILLRDPDTTIGHFLYQEDHVTMMVEYYDVKVNEQTCDDTSFFLSNVCFGKMRCMWEKRVKTAVEAGDPNQQICCKDSSCEEVPDVPHFGH